MNSSSSVIVHDGRVNKLCSLLHFIITAQLVTGIAAVHVHVADSSEGNALTARRMQHQVTPGGRSNTTSVRQIATTGAWGKERERERERERLADR